MSNEDKVADGLNRRYGEPYGNVRPEHFDDCKFPDDHLPGTPCGQRADEPGEPCRYCGDPIPVEPQEWEREQGLQPSCPNCWLPATPALLKGAFAPYGITVDSDPDVVGRFEIKRGPTS